MAKDGTILKYSTKTTDTLDQNSDSDNEEPIPSTSKQINQDVNPSCVESNSESLNENPFLLPPVLACLCENSSPQALFNYRLVGQHIWNELAVNAINQDKSVGVRLVKIVDPNRMNVGRIEDTAAFTHVPINTMISTLRAGGLKKSTLTRIYLNSSLTNSDLNEYLELNGQNIRVLHYQGDSLETLRNILKACAKNLMSLSLWSYRLKKENGENGIFKKGSDGIAPFELPRLESLAIASGETDISTGDAYRDSYCGWDTSEEILSRIFQASPHLKSLSARFSNSFILDSGLAFKALTTLCIKYKITNAQLRTLCHAGLKLKQLRLLGLYVAGYDYDDMINAYLTDPEWMKFRELLLNFIQTQATTLVYFGVCLFERCWPGRTGQHDSPHEQWSFGACFPRMPNLHTFMLDECSGTIPKADFRELFPKLKNLEIWGCGRTLEAAGPQQLNLAEYPLEIVNSLNSSISVRNIRGINPTMELAQIFPAIVEFHIQTRIPHGLPIYWPKLKHLYYKDYVDHCSAGAQAYIRRINKFLVGISPEESERIEEQRLGHDEFKKLQIPRSRPSIFDLNDLETFEFGFNCRYHYYEPFDRVEVNPAIEVLINLGLRRLVSSTCLKKINFVITRRVDYQTDPATLGNIQNVLPREKWHMEANLDHHKSEWKEIDGLFRDDPDIWDLGLTAGWYRERENPGEFDEVDLEMGYYPI